MELDTVMEDASNDQARQQIHMPGFSIGGIRQKRKHKEGEESSSDSEKEYITAISNNEVHTSNPAEREKLTKILPVARPATKIHKKYSKLLEALNLMSNDTNTSSPTPTPRPFKKLKFGLNVMGKATIPSPMSVSGEINMMDQDASNNNTNNNNQNQGIILSRLV